MDDQASTFCQRGGVCIHLGKHAPHCEALAPAGRSDTGMPCVRALGHPGDVHAYGFPQGAGTVDASVCGECLEVWPGHLFECPQYQKNGAGAPPAPWPIPPWPNARRAPGRGVCRNCKHAVAHWIAAGQDICSAPTPCGCEHYDPSPPTGSAPTSSAPTSAPSSSTPPAPPSSAASLLGFTADEIALFDRYAARMRLLGLRFGFDFGPDGSKLVALGALLIRASLEPAPRPTSTSTSTLRRRRR